MVLHDDQESVLWVGEIDRLARHCGLTISGIGFATTLRPWTQVP